MPALGGYMEPMRAMEPALGGYMEPMRAMERNNQHSIGKDQVKYH